MSPLTMITVRPTMRMHWEWRCGWCRLFLKETHGDHANLPTFRDRWLVGTLDTKGTT